METYKDHITLSPDMNEERLNTLRELFPDWFLLRTRRMKSQEQVFDSFLIIIMLFCLHFTDPHLAVW